MPRDKNEISDTKSGNRRDSLHYEIDHAPYLPSSQLIKLSYEDKPLSLNWNPTQDPCDVPLNEPSHSKPVSPNHDPPHSEECNGILNSLTDEKKTLYWVAALSLLLLGGILGFLLNRMNQGTQSPDVNRIYVNPSKGVDGAQGKSSAQVQTITHAFRKAQPGDQVRLESGDYVATSQAFPFAIPPDVSVEIAPNTTFLPVFSDIQGNPAQDSIQKLAMKRVIAGFPDGTFRPDAQVTRAQYAAMIVQAFNPVPKLAPKTFPDVADVKADNWANDKIQQAYRSQFMVGFPEDKDPFGQGNTFRPNDPITRGQAIASLVSGLGLGIGDGPVYPYQDQNDVPDWAREPVKIAVSRGLIPNRSGVTLRPNQPASRGEVATMIYQALIAQKKL
jgi:hypothetical protein